MNLPPEDRLSIHDLLGRYYQLLDGNESLSVENLFSEDGAIIVPTADFRGRKVIADFFAKRPRGAGRHGKHFITNLVVDAESSSRALAQFYLLYADISQSPKLKMIGNGKCTTAKLGQDWRIEQLVIEIESTAETAAKD